MLIVEPETDPLSLKDPLDVVDVCEKEERSSRWTFESDVISGIIGPDDTELVSSVRGVVDEEDIVEGNDSDDSDWKSKGERRRLCKTVSSKSNRPNRKVQGKSTGRTKRYRCELCEETYTTGTLLREHILSHCQYFPCKDCGKVFGELDSLQRHMADGHPSESHAGRDEIPEITSGKSFDAGEESKTRRKHQCEICRKTFITLSHLNVHMYRHSGKKWSCDGCGKTFSCERSLVRHRDTFPGDHWFPCGLCDMNFFRVVNVVKHMELKHPEALTEAKRVGRLTLSIRGKVTFVCFDCHEIFHESESLRSHKESIHSHPTPTADNGKETGENPSDLETVPRYKCDTCSKEFVSLEGFEYHVNNIHSAGRSEKAIGGEIDVAADQNAGESGKGSGFVCRTCRRSFLVEADLRDHEKSHNSGSKGSDVKPVTHQCCICPRTFGSSDGLKYHLATHTGERRYSCAECGRKFIKKTHLFEHIATHSRVKGFKCSQCPRTFSTHSAYRKHVKHFPGPHSFPCVKCGKLFTKESMLEKHMCVDLVKVTMAPEVKALLTTDGEMSTVEVATAEGADTSATEPDRPVENGNDEPGETSHSCYKCFKVFPTLDELQSHQNEHIGKQNYQCRFCPESFKRADDFGSHIRGHLGSSPYMCLGCNRKFISPLTLSMHAKKYPGDHSFTCTKCQRHFSSKDRLDKHECILQNADAFACACRTSFKTWSEFVLHAGTKPYRCCSCQLSYPTLMALARHIKKHTGLKPFSCDVCGKSFRARNNYLHHQNIHRDAKEIQCDHCDFKSKSQKRMDFHLYRKHEIGSNSSSTLCSVCGIIFPYVTQMKRHMDIEHGSETVRDDTKDEKKTSTPLLCTLCGKLLSNKYMLANHMKRVHDPDSEKQEPGYKCDDCDERFKTKRLLQRHADTHEVPCLRTCPVCSKDFYFGKDLRKHMRRHDTNKPFSCGRCGKTFKVSVSLKYHASICGRGVGRSAAAAVERGPHGGPVYGRTESDPFGNRPKWTQ